MSDLEDGLELDRGELAEAALATAAMVGPFDPGHDRKSELLSGLPALLIKHVLLEQGEERLHRGVVLAGADPAHRSVKAVVPEQAHELGRSELAPSVRMHHGASRATQG